jgi:hypothetical protein
MMKFRPSFLLLTTKFPTTTTFFVVPAAAVVARSHFSTKMQATADSSIAVEEGCSTRAVHDDVVVDGSRRKIAITQQPLHKTDWTDEDIRSKTFSVEFDESDLAEHKD